MKRKPNYYRRVWLNSGRGRAFMEFDNHTITISDCSRQIYLEFWTDEDASKEDRLAKLNRMIEELERYRDKFLAKQ